VARTLAYFRSFFNGLDSDELLIEVSGPRIARAIIETIAPGKAPLTRLIS